MKERDETYDWVRLWGTIFVVIGHSAYISAETNVGGVAYTLPENLSAAYNGAILSFFRYLASWVYQFHMPLFFMLSGAVLALKPIKKFDEFSREKIKRLIIPYFVYGWLFMLPVKYLAGYYDNASLTIAARSFLYGEESGHLWFLISLFWCMIIFVAIVKVLQKLKVESNYFILLICLVIMLTYDYIPFDFLEMKQGLSYIFWFALGYVFEKEKQKFPAWSNYKIIIFYIGTIILEYAEKRWLILDRNFTFLCGCLHTYLLARLCAIYLKKFTECKIWKVLIRNSFYVFIFHDPLEYVVLKIFFSFNLLESAAGCYLYLLTRTVIVFVVCVLLGEAVRFLKNKLKNIETRAVAKQV